MTLFAAWLEKTLDLQKNVYNIDYDSMSGDSPEALNKLIEYMRWNMLAVDDELAEMRQAISWKPWQHDEPYADKNELIKEAVDVLHFVANMIVAAGGTDEMLNEIYLEKMEKNRKRQLDGYKVRDKGVKCDLCARALDEYDPAQCRETPCPSRG
jgi:dimeric dUTPase (all-alpha-NTP-PPase superfamily)